VNTELKYFSQRDFETCNPPCKLQDMDHVLMKKLDIARQVAGLPFIVTSGFRSKIWEKEQGRDGTSSHTKGLAIDLKVQDSIARYKIINSLLSVGLSRIGIGNNFIHVDIDKDKPSNVIWHYYD
jgi:uncharacterized protein YcbK (DUF882 family)